MQLWGKAKKNKVQKKAKALPPTSAPHESRIWPKGWAHGSGTLCKSYNIGECQRHSLAREALTCPRGLRHACARCSGPHRAATCRYSHVFQLGDGTAPKVPLPEGADSWLTDADMYPPFAFSWFACLS